jgi:hypothetical protein
LNEEDKTKVKLLCHSLKAAKPICLVGPTSTGKSEYLKLAARDILK